MCLHHHAKDSANQYYDADLVLKYIKDYQYVKANPDVGHLSRSQIQPIENLKKLKGKIGSIHIKDQAEFGNPKTSAFRWELGNWMIKPYSKNSTSRVRWILCN
ncbi:MAG: hypothetical protein ACLUKN_10620 [Bacilli bacterium]